MSDAPLVLELDLGALAARPTALRPWSHPDPALERIGNWGGSALGLALLAARPPDRVALVVAAGECVRRGLPTAERASVLARAPLTGRLAEGQVGGELGPRLAAVTGALVLVGRAEPPGAVLVIEEDGQARLVARPELRGASPVETWRALAREHPSCAVLCIGPAGERCLPFANLARGGEEPSFVGRGGLGAVLGQLGLKAVVVRAEAPVPGEDPERGDLVRALSSSPRLAARAAGGTMELYDAFAARGDLRGDGYRGPLPREAGPRLAEEARERARERHGCRGCPTPCGWVFERSDGGRMGAHFSATYALGTNLGLPGLDDALHLLATCDRLGLDAKESGALLAVHRKAQERGLAPAGATGADREGLAACLVALVGDDPALEPLRGGAAAYARAVGLEEELTSARGEAARPEISRATLLGAFTSPGGSDPMRSFPFLVDAGGRAALEALAGDLGPLPPGAEDPASPAAKGRLVARHEDLVAAVNATGFCAFSTAGLLADGVCDLDRLARWILPPALAQPCEAEWRALAPGARLLAAGASLVLLACELDRRFGARQETPPAWARAALARPGMLDEYLAVRGLDAERAPRREALAALARPALLGWGRAALAGEVAAPAEDRREAPRARAAGRVELRGLGGERTVELALPATLLEVLRTAAREPGLERGLVADGRPLPSVWRAGRRLAPDDAVEAGDVLELVMAISGG